MKRFTLFIFVVVAVLQSCNKQPSWDVDALVPLVKSKLYIQDLLEDSLKTTGPEGDLRIVYESELFSLKVDSLFRIPDTTTEEVFTVPIGNIQLAPGQVFVNDTTTSSYDIQDVELRQAIVRSGQIQVELSSSIAEQTFFTYALPYATLNGVPFTATESIPPGSISNPSSLVKTYDLSGYVLDLRGPNFNSFNSLTSVVRAQIDPNGSVVTVSAGDFVKTKNTFTELIPEYARGYFGNRTETESSTDSLGIFNNIKGGQFNLEAATLELEIINEAGVDVRLKINELTAKSQSDSTALQSNLTQGFINLSRAKEGGSAIPPIITTRYNTTLNALNSNLPEFLSTLPDAVGYDIRFQLNPFGNASNSNDFIFYDTGLELQAKLQIPLRFAATELLLVDTLALEIEDEGRADTEPIQGGNLLVYANNYYPTDIFVQGYLADSNFVILDSLFAEPQYVEGGYPNSSGRVQTASKSMLTSPLTPQRINNLYDSDLLILEVELSTVNQPQTLTFYEDYHVAFSVVGDFTYRIEEQ